MEITVFERIRSLDFFDAPDEVILKQPTQLNSVDSIVCASHLSDEYCNRIEELFPRATLVHMPRVEGGGVF